jgi:predicted MFS family arabinose efflux permease
VFAAGVGLSLVGFAWTALAGDYWQLLPARALCAWGYATGTMACQRQLILLSGPGERARGLALFVGAVGIAAICGSSLGGLLAGQVGFRPVFALSALLALLALAVFRLAGGNASPSGPKLGESGPQLSLVELGRLLRDRRFALLMVGGAIPAKLALAGFLFYLTPLALHQQDYGPAAIGRAVMLYFVLVAAINPIASRLSDRYGWRLSLTVAGGAIIGVGGLAGLLGGEAAVWIGIASLGVGTGIATAPMQALATEVGAAAGATSVAVVLRTIERLGSVIGPLWAGIWFAAAGWAGAMTAIGAAVLAGTLLCLAAGGKARP